MVESIGSLNEFELLLLLLLPFTTIVVVVRFIITCAQSIIIIMEEEWSKDDFGFSRRLFGWMCRCDCDWSVMACEYSVEVAGCSIC